MYGGDEVSAIVLDVGSHTCKAGYAGEDVPKAVFPSHVGVLSDPATTEGGAVEKRKKLFVGINGLGFRRDHMEVVPSISNGTNAYNWENFEAVCSYALSDRLLVDSNSHPLLLAEKTFSHNRQNRQKLVELLFESFEAPAIFLCKSAVLSSFACGKSTSLVVDCGHSSTTVSAVLDGYVLQKSVIGSCIAGETLNQSLFNFLTLQKRVQIRPRYSFRRKEVGPAEFHLELLNFPETSISYEKYCQSGIVANLKESVCRLSESSYNEKEFVNMPTVPYELPDGQVIEVGSERHLIPELLFEPDFAKRIPEIESFIESYKSQAPNAVFSEEGVSSDVVNCISRCDADIRKELYSSVLVCGGGSCLGGFKERLEKELVAEAPQAVRVKVIASGSNTERKFSAWLGGSILASLGSFQQLWFSKAEYQEHGPNYVHRKCP